MKRFILTLLTIATLNACSSSKKEETSPLKAEVTSKLTGKWVVTGFESVTDKGTFFATIAEIENDSLGSSIETDTLVFNADGKHYSTSLVDLNYLWSVSNDGSELILNLETSSVKSNLKLYFTSNNVMKFETGVFGPINPKESEINAILRSRAALPLNIKGTKDQKENYKSLKSYIVYRKL